MICQKPQFRTVLEPVNHYQSSRCLLGGMLALLRREALERDRAQVALELGVELEQVLAQLESEGAGSMAQGGVRFWAIWALWMGLTAAAFVVTLAAGLHGRETAALVGVVATAVFCAMQARHCSR